MKTRFVTIILITLWGTAVAVTCRADGYAGVTSRKLLTTSTASNGQKISYLATDQPEVTALVVELPPGGETGWHLHTAPVYAYVLSGSLDVEMADGRSYVFRQGDAIVGVQNLAQNVRTVGNGPARLVVFSTGEQDRPNVVKVERPKRVLE
ncbi:cupin domain-containing protein [Oryzomonas japonica]|uniref:Cupin domain-containing protein n=1 Tax=Oryzomonas japonica TaxID=2603858 RepID=A0A7J4ZR24_9BACT|nr:cupin domain-containing protein [Oryzomonas japonica]KAB0665315.1 cupin domain-containing protein [Oryzomonas japonica]